MAKKHITLGEVLEYCEFTYEPTENKGEFVLVDMTGANWGGVDTFTFTNAAAAIERLEVYWTDYLISDLEARAVAAGVDESKVSEMRFADLRKYAHPDDIPIINAIIDPDTVIMPKWTVPKKAK